MKKANWLKNQDAKPLTYVLSLTGNTVAGLPWRKAHNQLIPLALYNAGGYTDVCDVNGE
jgi:hypothetical protein